MRVKLLTVSLVCRMRSSPIDAGGGVELLVPAAAVEQKEEEWWMLRHCVVGDAVLGLPNDVMAAA
jgi:hypothetical protein